MKFYTKKDFEELHKALTKMIEKALGKKRDLSRLAKN